MNDLTNWVATKLTEEGRVEVIGHTSEDFLIIKAIGGYEFLVAVLGINNIIQLSDVQPLFSEDIKPHLIVNIPSRTLWSGQAINFIHQAPAAFGKLGDISRAASEQAAENYRDKNMGFFINAISQHNNVSEFSYIYDNVFKACCLNGSSIIVAVIDTYNMSAEDVRNTRNRVGFFDVIVKSSSYGSITSHAAAAAESMGAQALMFRDLMRRLAQ